VSHELTREFLQLGEVELLHLQNFPFSQVVIL
jgi:hypothetical protein